MTLLASKKRILFSRPGWILPGATIDLDFANNRYWGGALDSLLSISRASTAYAQDSAGNLVSFASNVLRRTDLGLLIEEARTNLCLQSQTLTGTGWGASGSPGPTATADTAVAPDGTTTADTVSFGAGVSSYWTRAATFAASTAYTFSVYAKVVSGTRDFRLKYFDAGGGATQAAQTATTTWQRFTYTFTTSVGAGLGDFGFINLAAGTAGDVIFWGAQLEVGAFATSYIPTTTVSVTRAADVVTTSAALLAIWNAAASVYAMTNGVITSQRTNSIIASGPNGAGTQFQLMPVGLNWSATGAQATTGFTSGGINKSAGSWDVSGNGSFFLNNNAGATTAAHDFTGGGTTLYLGRRADGNYVDAYISRLAFWKSRHAALQALTA